MCIRNIRRKIKLVTSACGQLADTNLHQKQLITWQKEIKRMQDSNNKKVKSICIG